MLLQRMRCLKIGERTRARFGHADGRAVEFAQFSRSRPLRPPARRGQNSKPGSSQRATVIGKLLIWELNGTPVAEADGSCVHPLVRAESDHFAGSDLDPAPDR